MDSIPSGPMVLILGWYCDSPMTSLALACASKSCALALEPCWSGLYQVWMQKWGDDNAGSNSSSSSRVSKRLQEKDYYSNRKKFIRLVETGATHAAYVHAEIFNMSCERKSLTVLKLRDTLKSWTPVWVNCGGFGKEKGASSILVEALRSKAVTARHALAICSELVLVWGADPHASCGDGVRPLAIASARGFADVVKFLISRGCSLIQKSLGTYTVNKRQIKGVFTPHEWAVTMYSAEVENGTKENDLKRLKQCIELTRT